MSYLNDFKRMAVGRELPNLTEVTAKAPKNNVKYEVGDTIEYENHLGRIYKATVEYKSASKSRPGWRGYDPDAPSVNLAGYDDLVVRVVKKGGKVEADMGKAVPGEKLLGHGKPMKGKVMNPENRAALEKLLWGWQDEARLAEGTLACKSCGTKFKSQADADKGDCCEEPSVQSMWPVSGAAPSSGTNAAHEAAMRKAGWVSNRDKPEAFKVGDRALLSFSNGHEEQVEIKGFFKNGTVRVVSLSGQPRPHGVLLWKKTADIKESRLAESDDDIAKTIAQQMAGGVGKIRAILGAKTVVAVPNGLKFQWPNKKRSLGNVCVVTLRPDDTYDMEFFNGDKSVKKFEGLYAEDLKPTFEKHTGWYLSL